MVTRGSMGDRKAVDLRGPPNVAAGPIDARDDPAMLRRIIALCGRLSACASVDTHVEAVTRVLAESTGAQVILADRALTLLACASLRAAATVDQIRERVGAAGLDRVLEAVADNRRAVKIPYVGDVRVSVVVAPISVGEAVTGYLLTVGGPNRGLTEDGQLLVTEHAAMLCGVVLSRKLVVAGAAGRARDELIEGLLLAHNRNDPEVEWWAKHLGLDIARGHYVVTVALPERRAALLFPVVDSVRRRHCPDAVATVRADEIVLITPVTDAAPPTVQARTLGRRYADALTDARLGPPVIGIGTAYGSAGEISRSYKEARCALAARKRMKDVGGVTAFAELGIHRLLVRIPDMEDVEAFARDVLGALVDEEHATGIEYRATLAAYFEENRSPRRAGQQLHLHPNTVSYRVRRAEEITGLSLGSRRDRLMFEVALAILDGPKS